jgi:ubiquinone/menaquinone biosynthesis C-methylase UbiE
MIEDEWTRSTRHYYQRHAADYTTATLDIAMAHLIERFARGLAPGAQIADLGCGAGRDLRLLRRYGVYPIGLDFAEALATRAQRYSGAPVVVGDLRHLPFASNAFDGAWAAASLLHLKRTEIRAALAEIFRVMKPSAVFFGSIKSGIGEARDTDGRWFTYYSEQEWIEILIKIGFKDVLVESRLDDFDATSNLGRHSFWLPTFAQKP